MASARPYSVINLHSTILLQVYARAWKSIAFYEVNPREQFKSTQVFNSQYRFASHISFAVDKVLCFETCVWWWLWWQEYNSLIPPTNISSSCVSVHLTVHPSVTIRCSTNTAQLRIMQRVLHDNSVTSFLTPKSSAKFERGHPQGGTKYRWDSLK